MKSNSSLILERVTSVAVIVVALVVIVNYFNKSHGGYTLRAPTTQELTGTHVDLKSFRIVPSKTNLIIALSTSCHFCEEETSFYRDISKTRTPQLTSLLAIFPQEEGEAHEYLENHGIAVDAVQSKPLSTYGIDATPTLLMVDSTGTVIRSWVGSLEVSEKLRVLDQIRNGSS